MKNTPHSYFLKQHYAWFVTGILTLAYISSFIDRQILSLLVDDIRSDMHISEFQMSLLMGFSFALFYTFLGLPIGRWADRYNRRNIIAVGILIWSLMTALCGMVKNYTQFFLARIGVGVGEAALSPAAYSMIADYFPPHRLATAMSVYSMGIYLGSGLALVVGGMASQLASVQRIWTLPWLGKVYSWQMVFFFVGLPGLIIVLLMLLIKEPPRQGLGLKAKKQVSFRELFAYIRQNLKMVLFHSLAFGLLTMSTYSGSYWIPAFLMRNYGMSKSDVGFSYGIILTIFATLGIVIGGRLSDHLLAKGNANSRQWVILIAITGLFFSMIFLPLFSDLTVVILLLIPVCFFSSFGVGTGATVIQEIMPPQMRAQTSAFFLFVVNLLGLGFGPSATALVTQYVFKDDKLVGYSLLVVSTFALSLAALLIWQTISAYRKSMLFLKNYQKQP